MPLFKKPSEGSGTLVEVESVAALRASTYHTDQVSISTLGYYALGDGGHASFYWDAASTATDNNGSVIKPTSIGGGAGRWRFPPGPYNVRQFGAKGDNITDDRAAIQAAIDASGTVVSARGQRVFIPKTNDYYYCSDVIYLRRPCIFEGETGGLAGTARFRFPLGVDGFIAEFPSSGSDGGRFTGGIFRHVVMSATVAGTRAALTPYTVGQFLRPINAYYNGYVYKVTTGGTTGSSQPTWPTTVGATVTDGDVVWTCYHLAAIRIYDGLVQMEDVTIISSSPT